MPYEYPAPLAERKIWHPVVWPQNVDPVKEEQQSKLVDKPHLRIVNNVRRFLKESETNPELRQKMIEDMLLALPSASKTV